MHFQTHVRLWRNSFRIGCRFSDKLRFGCLSYGRVPVLKRLLPYGRYLLCLPEPMGRLDLKLRSISDFIVFQEIFSDKTYDLPYPEIPKTILDLGANVGFATLYFHRRFPHARLAAVEPIHGNFAAARRNWEANSVRPAMFEAAVSTADGQLEMEITPADFGHRVVSPDDPEPSIHATVQVEALSVATILNRLGWEQVDLLKVDIEGYEATLLTQACEWLSRVTTLCIECHGSFGEKQLREVAEAHGFKTLTHAQEHTWLLTRFPRS